MSRDNVNLDREKLGTKGWREVQKNYIAFRLEKKNRAVMYFWGAASRKVATIRGPSKKIKRKIANTVTMRECKDFRKNMGFKVMSLNMNTDL